MSAQGGAMSVTTVVAQPWETRLVIDKSPNGAAVSVGFFHD